ncbi:MULTISPECIES: type I-E CRISPR-associated protein Cse1/CasA [Thiorhodovibrio]|uniref:type I-E CRISPR-associated protein Cse1/CasA n=1 Tax=Thiorhodovibrio TaxID=61593 RepID=UPI0019119129|nr:MULTISPECIES: type I-E CRISPR-associated protein Cse1/CasA [Thiorhodovibrio]MBK5969328.1 type I-E CRISPR-associated protein Cse1/CasA [Thiorhodovibrio winogradskyi]WPL13665.1 CRISPR-associated protein CasA/Cse1 [Thiorhodovibrio litoralis]
MTLHYSLLDEPLIGVRLAADGSWTQLSLPALFVALTGDRIRDFPALRPHQRHPWHAFLVQLAALALHQSGRTEPFADETAWKAALLALTPDDPDGAAWCLVSPPDRPALMQAPVPEGTLKAWKNQLQVPDEIDMLVTSKNHDLKAARMTRCAPEDWLLALISLQTQEGFLGAGNYGISRMNGGFASRPAIGIVPVGGWGQRWQRDVRRLLDTRAEIVSDMDLCDQGGIALVWLHPWSGTESLAFSALDPFYIEICRRVRLIGSTTGLAALGTGSKVARIEAKSRNGMTGDAWTPIDLRAGKALTITAKGFDYKLAAELLFGQQKYRPPVAQTLVESDGQQGLVILAQGVTRGQGKTEGYHERRIPLSPKVRRFLMKKQTDTLAKIAAERISDISKIRSVLWTALATLFENGASKEKFGDSAKDKANVFSKHFEQHEDSRFFDGVLSLNDEVEAEYPEEIRLHWYLDMAERAEAILVDAFQSGPRSGEQRYRARAAALRRLRGGLRNPKTLPTLAHYYKAQQDSKETPDAQP